MRILICGGRNFGDRELFARTMVPYRHTATLILHGAARGADSIADEWARHWRIPVQAYPAAWDRGDRAAGPIRNAKMLAEGKPDLVIGFPGGRGTADMLRKARAAGVRAVEIPGRA